MHAIPSRQDAASFTAQVKQARGEGITLLLAQILSGLTAPPPKRIKQARGEGITLLRAQILSGLITLANALRFFWFDAI